MKRTLSRISGKYVVMVDTESASHVIPMSFFRDVVCGRVDMTALEGHRGLIPVIISEWLCDAVNEDKGPAISNTMIEDGKRERQKRENGENILQFRKRE